MNVFLCDFSSSVLYDVACNLQKQGFSIVYWVAAKDIYRDLVIKDTQKFPQTIFHNQLEAIRAIPANGVDTLEFFPPSSKLLSQLLECESIVLTMMTRLDFSYMSVLEKKHIYYKYVTYWNGILTLMKPDVIIFSDVPHVAYNFVLYSLAKLYNIPTIMLEVANVQDRLIVVQDYKKASESLLDYYHLIENEVHTLDEIPVAEKDYFLKLSDVYYDATPFYKKDRDLKMKKKLRLFPKINKIIKNIFKMVFFKTTYYYIKYQFFYSGESMSFKSGKNYKNYFYLKKFKRLKDAYKKEYLALESYPNMNKKFIYIPLHYQPECTTSPLAMYYVDMIFMVKTVAAALPEDWIIYVKEYSIQWDSHDHRSHLFRYNGYYKELAAIKNVKLISPNISTYDLIKNCQAVATASGTAGLEAIVRQRPVLLFGYPWYMYCEGIFRVDSPDSCTKAIETIINGYTVNQQKVLNYYIALQSVVIKANKTNFFDSFSSLSHFDSVMNITEGFLKELKKVKNT